MYLRERKALNAEIHKENEVRKVLNLFVPMVMLELKEFDGQKIIKKDTELVKKFADKIQFLQSNRNSIKVKAIKGFKHASLQCIYVTATDYSVRLEVSLSFADSDHTCCYAKGTKYLCDVKHALMGCDGQGTVEKLHDWEPLEMLSAAQEWKNYEKAAKAKDAAEKAITGVWYGLRAWLR